MIKIKLPDFSLQFNYRDLNDFRDDLMTFPGGIYFLCDKYQNYLYIGKSKNTYNRLLQHRRSKFSDEVSEVKVIFEDNPSYRDILETYAIMEFGPLYNIDKVYKDNKGSKVREILSFLYEEELYLEERISDLRMMRDEMVTEITPPTISRPFGHFGEDSESESLRYRDSLEALFLFRENYDIEDEYELQEIKRELEETLEELSKLRNVIRRYTEDLRV